MVDQNIRRAYSPVDICEMFNISKSTLLRWERESVISPALRDNLDQRRYSEENVKEIGQLMKRQLATQFRRTSLNEDRRGIERAHETLYVWKFILNEPTALDELENYPSLSEESIKKLCKIGFERYRPSSPMFHRIAELIAKKSRQLCEMNDRSSVDV